MKVKIVQDEGKTNYDRIECVSSALPYLEKYFKNIHAHAYREEPPIENYSAYFYTYKMVNNPLRTSLPTLTIPNDPMWRPDCFYDSPAPSIDISTLQELGYSTEKMFRLYLGEEPCGFLIAEKNVLIATDWTHARCNMPMIKAIVEYLVDGGYLTTAPAMRKKRLSIQLGCDPELEQLAGVTGYTVIPPTVSHSTSEEIGVDGSGAQIELRPGAHASPGSIVRKIKSLIERLPPVGIVGNRHPLGGHIHIGGVKPSRELIKLFDDFIGKLSVKTSGTARGSYASLGAYETKTYGFEYRSPASTWLHNPEIARIMFKLTKNLVLLAHSTTGIEYEMDSTGVPSLASYEKVLTTDEAIEFISFHKNYKPELKPINCNWGVAPVVPRVATLVFRDDWHSTVRSHFNRAFTELSCDYPIFFFGLMSDRGNVVANFEVPGYETIYHHPHVIEGGFWFGVPMSVRSNEVSRGTMLWFIDIAFRSITAILNEGRYVCTQQAEVPVAPNQIAPDFSMEALQEIMGRTAATQNITLIPTEDDDDTMAETTE